MLQRVEAGQGDELELVAQGAELLLEARELRLVEVSLPVERWRAVVGEQLARVLLVDRLGKLPSLGEIGFGGLEPEHVRMRCVRAGARERRLAAVSDHEE